MKKQSSRALLILIFTVLLLLPPRAQALNRYLRVGFNANTPPFQFLDKDGQSVGIHIDMMNAIAARNDYEMSFIPFETNRDCINALQAGEIDLVLGALESSGPFAGCSRTDPLTSSQLCLVVANDTIGRGGHISTAICVSDTIQHTLLANLNIHQFISVGSQAAVYARHQELPDSAMLGIKDSLIYQLEESGQDSNYTVLYNYLGALEFCMLVRSGDQELLRAMNNSISEFKATQEYESICTHWLPAGSEAQMRRTLRLVCIASAVAAAAVGTYIILTRRIQQLLRRRVAEQTREIQQAKQTLEQQYAQLQDESDLRNRIIKYSPSGMMLVDRAGAITLMNKSAIAIAGLKDAPIGQSAATIPVFREILAREGERLFISGTMVERSKLYIGVSPADTHCYSYMTHQIIQYGAVTGVLLTVQDVTEAERQQQEEFERQKSSALTRIAAGIAHEIRNPLMTIRTFASLIGTKGDDRQVQESFAKYVPDEVDRINRLIDNLIHYAKPPRRNPERVCVEELVSDSLSLVRPILRKSAFRLRQHIEPEVYIFADRDQIKQVMINILLNGVEAMEQKCAAAGQPLSLTLSVQAEAQAENRVVIAICDEGSGMTEQELSICREPFFSTKQTGTGLGLSLCEQYIRENHGVMELSSRKNEYTRISLIFERS